MTTYTVRDAPPVKGQPGGFLQVVGNRGQVLCTTAVRSDAEKICRALNALPRALQVVSARLAELETLPLVLEPGEPLSQATQSEMSACREVLALAEGA